MRLPQTSVAAAPISPQFDEAPRLYVASQCRLAEPLIVVSPVLRRPTVVRLPAIAALVARPIPVAVACLFSYYRY